MQFDMGPVCIPDSVHIVKSVTSRLLSCPGALVTRLKRSHSHPFSFIVCRYDTVAKLGITASKQHLQATFPDGIPLETAFVSPSVIHQLDASAEDAVASGSWCDVQALLPPALTHEDTAAVLEHCSVMQPSGQLQTLLCCAGVIVQV